MLCGLRRVFQLLWGSGKQDLGAIKIMQRAITIVVLAAAAVGGAWYASRTPQAPPVIVTETLAMPASSSITVHISGAVQSPGLVQVSADGRIADAVAAAGGALPSAELNGLNLASGLVDGQQVIVPEQGAPLPPGQTSSGRIQLNSATAKDLEGLAGVGPVLAARIVAHREEQGPFAVVEDLLDVSGIGEAKLAALRDELDVP